LPVDNYIQLFTALSKQVHSGNLITGQIDEAVTLFTQQALMHGVEKGYGITLKDVDYTTPDAAMLAHLEKNTFYFSAAKNYWNVKELNHALIGDDGKVKSFSKFKEAADAINEKYNVTHLRAEYNHAIASSQMARQWQDIKKASGTHPYLKYVTAGDAHVRALHANWNGIIRKWDDAFWNNYYPPNGWNCRCDIEQLQNATETSPSKLPNITDKTDGEKLDIHPLFQTNCAKNGEVFPATHPYHALPDADAQDVQAAANKIWKSESNGFTQVAEYKNGSKIYVHALADLSDLEDNVKQSTFWAQQIKGEFKILPHSNVTGDKNPELEFNGVLSDYKESKQAFSKGALEDRIKEAVSKGCSSVFYNITKEGINANEMYRVVKGILLNADIQKKYPNIIETFYFRKENKFAIYTAEELETLLKHK
jgi:SPP1 gp7 family putative phage head morphogenesis protein